MRIGIIGCGDIARKAYIPGIADYSNIRLQAVADLDMDRARELAAQAQVPALSVDDLLTCDDIDVVLNLTTPAAHVSVNRRIIAAGKHAYAEKPLALQASEAEDLMSDLKKSGLRLGCAPDTVLGAGIQRCRQLLDNGAIGEPLSFTAFMAGSGHESWHPAPQFYYAPGGGPLYDMGPYYLTTLIHLLGAVESVCAMSKRSCDERVISSEPLAGTRIPVAVDTQINACLRFCNGVIGSLIMSFDTWEHHLPRLELHGREGSMALPDPNTFAGPLLLSTRSQAEWQEQDLHHPIGHRGLGLAEMAAAISEDRPHLTHSDVAYHVQEVMDSIHLAASCNETIRIVSSCQRPAALPETLAWRRD